MSSLKYKRQSRTSFILLRLLTYLLSFNLVRVQKESLGLLLTACDQFKATRSKFGVTPPNPDALGSRWIYHSSSFPLRQL